VLALFAAAAEADFQFEFVGAAEARCGAIESYVSRYFGRQALLKVGGFERAAFDGYGAMGRRATSLITGNGREEQSGLMLE